MFAIKSRLYTTLASLLGCAFMLSSGAIADDPTLLLRTTPSNIRVKIPSEIVNAGIPDVKIQGITINKKKSDDPRCSFLIYEWTYRSRAEIMSADTARSLNRQFNIEKPQGAGIR